MYDIPTEQMTVIPHNEMYCDALLKGSIVEFLTVNFNCNKDNPNYFFIQSIRKAASLIIKRVEVIAEERRLVSVAGNCI